MKLMSAALLLGGAFMPSLAAAQPSQPEQIAGTLTAEGWTESNPGSVKAAAAEAAAVDAPAKDDLAPLPDGPPAHQAASAVVQVANWVVATGDNGGLPFMILDKTSAAIFMFDAHGQSMGATPVLIGSAHGDDSIPGIGNRELKAIKAEEKTTPAGRFVAKFGPALGKYRQVLWVNFADSIALHPVITSNSKENRTKRLKSSSPLDNRITYGCINVSADFYKNVVRPLFSKTAGIAYILPESRQLAEVIPGFRPDLAASAPQVALNAGG